MDTSAMIWAECSLVFIYLFKRIKGSLDTLTRFTKDFSSGGQEGPLQWSDEIFITICSCIELRASVVFNYTYWYSYEKKHRRKPLLPPLCEDGVKLTRLPLLSGVAKCGVELQCAGWLLTGRVTCWSWAQLLGQVVKSSRSFALRSAADTQAEQT